MNRYRLYSLIVLGILIISQVVLIILAIPKFNSSADATSQQSVTTGKETFAKAKVLDIESETKGESVAGQNATVTQQVKVLVLDGPDKSQEVSITNSFPETLSNKKVSKGETLLLIKVDNNNQSGTKISQYTINDKYRLDNVWIVVGLFIILVLVVIQLKGVWAILGLASGLGIVSLYTIPRMIAGDNALIVTLISAGLIAAVTLYLAHGFNKRTSLAMLSIVATILVSINLSVWFIDLVKLYGTGTEDSFFLQSGTLGNLNLRGLVLAGIVISSIGVLDDVSSSQAATVDELNKANPNMTILQLYSRAMSVGREHIASMVNSLVLIYLGTSISTFILLFAVNQRPLWVTLNLEQVGQEIVSSLVVSMGLILTVPITTFIASVFLKKG